MICPFQKAHFPKYRTQLLPGQKKKSILCSHVPVVLDEPHSGCKKGVLSILGALIDPEKAMDLLPRVGGGVHIRAKVCR